MLMDWLARIAAFVRTCASLMMASPSTSKAVQSSTQFLIADDHIVAAVAAPIVGKGSAVGADGQLPTCRVIGLAVADPCRPAARRALRPAQAAPAFLSWLRTHGLDSRPWAVDDLWYIAEVDFAVAMDLELPPRNMFLGALQKAAGVSVQYDKRIKIGGKPKKTTVYTFEVGDQTDEIRLAA